MDGLRHDIRDGFNAYEFAASYDGSMLTLTLTEDEMSGMREASKPHRNRTITVEICSSEPKLITLSCGDQIWRGSVVLSGTVNLDPIPLASCDGWITVNAAELSDDRNEGWRNAPCPMPDGDPVGSDGTGATWPDYDGYDPDDPRASIPESRPEPEPEPTTTPEPMPEPDTMPTPLLFTLTDPQGDVEGDGSRSYADALRFDLKRFSMWAPDDYGWAAVEFETWGPVDMGNTVCCDVAGSNDPPEIYIVLSEGNNIRSLVALMEGGSNQWQLRYIFRRGTVADIDETARGSSGRYIRVDQPLMPGVANSFKFYVHIPPDLRNRNLQVVPVIASTLSHFDRVLVNDGFYHHFIP